jgi:ribosome-interacting GTPase 1
VFGLLQATEYHLGTLKAKLAKLRTQLLEPPKSAGGVGEGFDVQKFGAYVFTINMFHFDDCVSSALLDFILRAICILLRS